jgi:GT2 family glycosyltransferase
VRPPRAAAAAPRAPKVEAVVISYNGRQFIGPAIRSLLEQDWPALRVTVVDNASSDGSAGWLREQFPSIQVVASPRNLGFAAGNNLAFARSDADWFFLLNQDAVAQPDCVRELVTIGERRADIAVLGAKMLMQRCPTILNSAGIRINEAGWAVDRRIGEKDLNRSPLPENVFGACGGAMLLRASALRECGAFDERFFMYFEDVDLCWRLRLAGWHVWYVPTAVVLHDWHGDRGAGDRAARRRFLCERNRWLCLFKNARAGTIRRLWRSLRSYDCERLATVRREIARGVDVDYFRMVGNAIRRAWRWNLLHLPGTLLARARVQRLRRRGDSELARWIEPGVSEPSHVGDLTAIRDRFTAVAVPALVIGKTDQDSLGPGWHPREGEPGGVQWRWTKAEAWCYLRPERDVARLRIRVGGRPMPGRVELSVDGELLPAAQHDGRGDVWLEFECPRPLPPGEVVELCLRPETFVPQQVGLGGDTRELGIPVIEIVAG